MLLHLPSPAMLRGATTSGILFKVISVALFAIMEAVAKTLTPDYPVLQTVFFRFFFAFVPLLPFIIRDGGIMALKTRRLGAHFSRGLLGVAAMFLFFYSFSRLPLTVTSSIAFAAPLIMTALAGPFLGESVGARRWAAVMIGFVGVLIVMKPGPQLFDPAALAAIAGAACSAVTATLVRSLTRTEHSSTIVFYFTLSGTMAGLVLLPFVWVTPTFVDFCLLVGVGILGGLAQMAMTTSLRRAPVAVTAPFEYTKLLWASGFDLVLWATLPGWNTILGGGLIMATGLYILRREVALGKLRGPAASASPDQAQSVRPPGAS